MLGYFNRTQAVLEGSWYHFQILLHVEIVVIIFSVLTISFWFSVIVTAKNMHRNVRVINAFYYGQYVFQLIFWSLQPIIILSGTIDDHDKFSNDLFTMCSYVRIIGMFYAFCALPAMVIERSFATFMVEDYEKNNHSCIGNMTVLIQWIFAIGLGIHFNHAKSTVQHTIGAIVANSLAILLNIFNERVNSKYYYELDRVTYSLSERFQITENIRTAKMFNRIVWSIGFFNVIVNSCLIIDNYNIPLTLKNVASVSCDFSILSYGVIVPIVYYQQTESWKKRVAVILKRWCKSRVGPLKDTFGHEMTSNSAGQETNRYFEMLANQWK